LRSNTKGYSGKTHYTDSQNGDISVSSGRELYHLQFSLQAASPETFGYTLVCHLLRNIFVTNVIEFSYGYHKRSVFEGSGSDAGIYYKNEKLNS
jgi:hypothetical protein